MPLFTAARRLGFGSYPLDSHHARNVPGQVVAVELDLQVRQAIGLNPLAQCFRQSVVDAFLDITIGQRVECTDQVIEWHAGLGGAKRIAIKILTNELVGQIVSQISVDELGAQQVVTVLAQHFAKRIVNRRFHRTGRNQLGKPRHRLG